METLFTKIIEGKIPSVPLYRDQECLVILDIAPVNKGHVLVISTSPYPTIGSCPPATLAHLMAVVQKVDDVLRSRLGAEATNIVINNGPAAGQEVPHLHIHVIPRYRDDGKHLIFEKEKYQEREMALLGEKLHFS